jgi:putative ATP-dependent endonuclease of OLD family
LEILVRLVSFTTSKYRSIIKSTRLAIGDYTVLVGPNNEGKSNLVRALVTALDYLSSREIVNLKLLRRRYYSKLAGGYVWERDYPLQLQDKTPPGVTTFSLEFELTDEEKTIFHAKVGSKLGRTLTIELSFGQEEVAFRVKVQGLAAKILSDRHKDIAAFIQSRLQLAYIPSARGSEATGRVVEALLLKELSSLDDNTAYIDHLREIEKIRSEAFQGLSSRITESVKSLVPYVKRVELIFEHTAGSFSSRMRDDFDVSVDDGNATSLALKGDGLQSLVAIALMREASRESAEGKSLVLAIEEPETHLHPDGIRALRPMLIGISQVHQLIITTHSPILIERADITANIIVKGNKSKTAGSIKEIRKVLGTEVSDNLISAELVLLAEGREDVMIIEKYILDCSKVLSRAIEDGRMILESLIGCGNLAFKASMYKSMICGVHAFLDDDAAGQAALAKAISVNALEQSEYHFARILSHKETELEDLVLPSCYLNAIETKYGINIGQLFTKGNAKWSVRLEKAFRNKNKLWSDEIKSDCKIIVAQAVVNSDNEYLSPKGKECLDEMLRVLEALLGDRKKALKTSPYRRRQIISL